MISYSLVLFAAQPSAAALELWIIEFLTFLVKVKFARNNVLVGNTGPVHVCTCNVPKKIAHIKGGTVPFILTTHMAGIVELGNPLGTVWVFLVPPCISTPPYFASISWCNTMGAPNFVRRECSGRSFFGCREWPPNMKCGVVWVRWSGVCIYSRERWQRKFPQGSGLGCKRSFYFTPRASFYSGHCVAFLSAKKGLAWQPYRSVLSK